MYDGSALFADTGGLVGILLGLSCVAMFDYLAERVSSIWRTFRPGKGRRMGVRAAEKQEEG